MLSAPLRERFGIFHHLDFYSESELARIVERSAAILGATLETGGAEEIARRARGTPRIANRLLRRGRAHAHGTTPGALTPPVPPHAAAPGGGAARRPRRPRPPRPPGG